VFGSSYVGPRN